MPVFLLASGRVDVYGGSAPDPQSAAGTARFRGGSLPPSKKRDILMLVPALAIVVGLVLLVWSADRFVEGAASGRAIANGRDEGYTKLLFDDSPEAHGHGKILGGGIVGTHAGDMIGEIALAIEMGADAVDIGKTIHPHPTLGESIGMAAEIAHGSCTDVPPQRK